MNRKPRVLEHYFTAHPTSALHERTITTILRGNHVTFSTANSLFSANKIDTGTRILIENVTLQPTWQVLDLGCGYGPVGISLAKAHSDLVLVMSDVNARATKLARKNAIQNHITAEIITSEGFAHIPQEFDTILLNPPQTAGKKVCETLIAQSKEHLVIGGLLQIVARHNKGGAQLEKYMISVFGNAAQVAKQSGYRVYVSQKK